MSTVAQKIAPSWLGAMAFFVGLEMEALPGFRLGLPSKCFRCESAEVQGRSPCRCECFEEHVDVVLGRREVIRWRGWACLLILRQGGILFSYQGLQVFNTAFRPLHSFLQVERVRSANIGPAWVVPRCLA